jgi:hypothetical protein
MRGNFRMNERKGFGRSPYSNSYMDCAAKKSQGTGRLASHFKMTECLCLVQMGGEARRWWQREELLGCSVSSQREAVTTMAWKDQLWSGECGPVHGTESLCHGSQQKCAGTFSRHASLPLVLMRQDSLLCPMEVSSQAQQHSFPTQDAVTQSHVLGIPNTVQSDTSVSQDTGFELFLYFMLLSTGHIW